MQFPWKPAAHNQLMCSQSQAMGTRAELVSCVIMLIFDHLKPTGSKGLVYISVSKFQMSWLFQEATKTLYLPKHNKLDEEAVTFMIHHIFDISLSFSVFTIESKCQITPP